MSNGDNYTQTLDELKSIERNIQNDLKELKSISQNNNTANTFPIENTLRKNIDSYSSKINRLEDDYMKNSKDIKYIIPEREYIRRLNEIQDLKANFGKIKEAYDSVLDNKYKFV